MTQRLEVLMLCSNSEHEESRLKLDNEYHAIYEALKGSDYKAHPFPSPSPAQLPGIFNDSKPYIVHFSGHGDREGRMQFVNGAEVVEHDELAGVFAGHLEGRHEIKCVVLNACHSAELATFIGRYVHYVVGMEHAIPDASAISFSKGFYEALAEGKIFRQAFRRGWRRIGLEGQPGDRAPRLYEWGKPCKGAHIEGVDEDDGVELTLAPAEFEQWKAQAALEIADILRDCEGLRVCMGECEDWRQQTDVGESALAETLLTTPVKELGAHFLGRMQSARDSSNPLELAEGLRHLFELVQPIVVATYVRRRALGDGLEMINAKKVKAVETMHAAARKRRTRWVGSGDQRRPEARLELCVLPEPGATDDERLLSIVKGGVGRDPRAAAEYELEDDDDDLESWADVLKDELYQDKTNGLPHYGVTDRLDAKERALLSRLKGLLPDLELFVSELSKDDKHFENRVLASQRRFYQTYDQIIADHS